ncbi:MAG: hypothetical protein ACLPX5_16675 [Dissulfurispiraceae bacterium]
MEYHLEELGGTAKNYSHRVISAGQRMTQLINALLTMSWLTRWGLHEKTVYIGAMAKMVAHELKMRDPKPKTTFVIDDNVTLKGKMIMLQAVLENLLDNNSRLFMASTSG